MYTAIKATEMLDYLLKLKELADRGNIPAESNGICSNLTIVSQVQSYGFVEKYSFGWPEHSGNSEYPIRGKFSTFQWRGERGAARLRLLDYLIEQMENLGDAEVNWEESV